MTAPTRPLKRAIREVLAKTGYDFQVYKRPTRGAARYRLDFTPQAVFDYFPHWDTRHLVDGVEYGGEAAAYAGVEASILNDPRLPEEVPFLGRSVLELGPLEAGQTALLKGLGAGRVVAIEGRAENFIKCCAVAQLLRLEDVHFRLGDLRSATVDTVGRFDIAFASGVLYHLDDPHVAIANMANLADVLVVSSHVVNEDRHAGRAAEALSTDKGEYRGQWAVEGPPGEIGAGLQMRSFKPFAEELKRMVRDFGYPDVTDLGVVKRQNGQWSARLIGRR